MIKYYLLIVLVLIAIPRLGYSFSATSSGGLPGVLITNTPSGGGQCVTSTGLTTGQWGNCGSGNLPSIPGTGGEFLSENTSSASWVAFSGDFTCSTSSLGLCTVASTHLSSALPIAQGGTGTTTPGLVQGTNITITGSWPNQTINSSGGSGSGTVNSGGVGNPAYYASTGTAVSPVANIIHAGSGTLAAAFTALGSNPGIVIADPGQVYTVAAPLTWGTSADQTLEVYGRINCSDTTGGRDCLDVDVHGHLIGPGPGDGAANNGCVITTNSITTNITSMVTNASHTAGDGFDFRNCLLDPNTSSTITKGELWLSGAEGFNTVSNIRFTQPPVGGSNSGIIYAVDDNGGTRAWNQIDNYAVSVTCGGATGATGISLAVNAGGGGANFTFLGGAVVDCGATSTLLNIAGSSSKQITNVKFVNTYFESTGSGDLVDITDGYAISLDNVFFNQAGGTATNCVSIAGQANNSGVITVTGRSSPSTCTNVINNSISGFTKTTAGNIDYTYPGTNGGAIKVIDGSTQFNSFGPQLYYSAAGTALPSCAASGARQLACVSDETSACTVGNTYSSGGSNKCQVQCNTAGTLWKVNGVPCY